MDFHRLTMDSQWNYIDSFIDLHGLEWTYVDLQGTGIDGFMDLHKIAWTCSRYAGFAWTCIDLQGTCNDLHRQFYGLAWYGTDLHRLNRVEHRVTRDLHRQL